MSGEMLSTRDESAELEHSVARQQDTTTVLPLAHTGLQSSVNGARLARCATGNSSVQRARYADAPIPRPPQLMNSRSPRTAADRTGGRRRAVRLAGHVPTSSPSPQRRARREGASREAGPPPPFGGLPQGSLRDRRPARDRAFGRAFAAEKPRVFARNQRFHRDRCIRFSRAERLKPSRPVPPVSFAI